MRQYANVCLIFIKIVEIIENYLNSFKTKHYSAFLRHCDCDTYLTKECKRSYENFSEFSAVPLEFWFGRLFHYDKGCLVSPSGHTPGGELETFKTEKTIRKAEIAKLTFLKNSILVWNSD